ncbi:hypothetical protein VNO78_22538 [Psophocarpus tetragonolobus]|uniref:U3 small nucleolar RNA-associated protein 6 N-terminal domain-containing protein n=1 Tax=Psophocarpus tetragonolobus TaxID=3891 RepID=A0AAN9S361_PSOTE
MLRNGCKEGEKGVSSRRTYEEEKGSRKASEETKKKVVGKIRREIAEIVKQRRKLEYRIKHPSPLKQDFLAYVEYETQLNALHELHKKSGTCEMMKQSNKKVKKSKSDYASLHRTIEIYKLTLN